MTYYASSERSDPGSTEPWRQYRRWQAARRRRRIAAVAFGVALLASFTAAFWPRTTQHEDAAAAAPAVAFDAPQRGISLTGTPWHAVPPSPPERDAIAALVGSTTPPAAPEKPIGAPDPSPSKAELAPEAAAATAPPAPSPPEAASATPAVAADAGAVAPVPSEAPAPQAKAASAPEPPKAQPAKRGLRGGIHVQLASFGSEAKAKSALAQLQQAHRDVLAPIDPRVQRAELADGRTVFRVESAPLADAGKARRVCAELHRRGLDCQFRR